MKKSKSSLILILLVFLCPAVITTLSGATTLYPFASFDWLKQVGENADYQAGINDFCITDAHQTTAIGLGLTTGGALHFGFELQYTLKGTALMHDPSDGDTLSIDTYARALATVLAGYKVIDSSNLTLAIEAGGGGLFMLGAEDKIYTSGHGLETTIMAPEKTTSAQVFAGIALNYFFSKSMGLHLGARYFFYLLTPKQQSFSAQAGLAFRL